MYITATVIQYKYIFTIEMLQMEKMSVIMVWKAVRKMLFAARCSDDIYQQELK